MIVWAYAYIQSDEPETYDLFDHSSGSAFIDCIFSIDGSDQVTTCQADAGDSPALYFPDDYGNFAAGSELKMTVSTSFIHFYFYYSSISKFLHQNLTNGQTLFLQVQIHMTDLKL
jgi:hypothetical protein